MNDIARKPIPTGIRWVGGFTAAVLVAQLGLNQPLQTSAAPQGMLSFQLATTGEGAAAIVESSRFPVDRGGRPREAWHLLESNAGDGTNHVTARSR